MLEYVSASCLIMPSLVSRPHPTCERGGSGDFAQKPRSLLTFRQEFQTANEIVENSILFLLGARSCKSLLQSCILFHA